MSPLHTALQDLVAYGRDQLDRATAGKDREPYQFWSGWIAALERAVRQVDLTDMDATTRPETFARELEALINRFSQEHLSNTPDWILAEYLLLCLSAWNHSTTRREAWYGRVPGETA